LADASAATDVAGEKVELARRVFDAVTRRDVPRLISLTDPEVEWRSFFAELGQQGVYRGHDGIRQYLHDLDDAWEVLAPEVTDTLEIGDLAVLVGRLRYRGKTSGVDTEVPAGWIVRFRNDKVASLRAFQKPEEAFAALGQIP
jgi:ketosteroid isomerase-like protein